ncbi:MAG: hypothetical protein KDK05_32165 [Candidatus Competibacteraceae bacterium]|nr:hypothetical protein [Candidatus Competibacteraceae bacterium]
MIKKLTVEIDDTEIELTPEQAKQLRDELLQIYPVDSAPVQPVFPLPSPYDWWHIPEITCGQTACNFRDKSVWQ